MLSLIHKNDRRGFLQLNGKSVTAEQLARMVGCSTDEVFRLLAELVDAGVPSVQDDGLIFSRRMVRDEATRRTRRLAGKKGADSRWNGKGDGKPDGKGDGKGLPPDPEPEPDVGEESPNPSCPEPQAASGPVDCSSGNGGDGLEVPNFTVWLGHSAKKRLKEKTRKNIVREMSDSKRTKNGQKAPHRTEQNRTEFGEESPSPSCPEPQAASGPVDCSSGNGGDGLNKKERLRQ